MPVDHTSALLSALISAIKADTALAQVIAGRIYDYVPSGPTYPFCRISPLQSRPFEGDCINGNEIHFTVHGFTREYGRAGAAGLGAAIVALLGRANLDLGAGVDADIRVEGWSVLEDTGEKGAWHASVNLIATTAQ